MDSQADTYIEECFEKKCNEGTFSNHKDVLNQWRIDKEYYASYTAISGFDFQHYSMHDKSHSEAILRYIEMILGRERVENLNASDLWLLLESAYCHDIGMSITYKELIKIWKKKDFKDYVKTSLFHESRDKRLVAKIYKKMDRLVHNRKILEKYEDMEDLAECEPEFNEMLGRKCWPVIWERYILMLYTEYVRRKHPEYSRKRIVRYAEKGIKKVPERMYDVVADVAFLHGEDFEEIFQTVEMEENGFGAERMHPRFAAAMLRIGDLLDMDSNRFNIRMTKHMGIIPLESTLHMKKHKAIKHLSYSQNVIEASAYSDELEVCKTTYWWFEYLDKEVEDLICSWNKIVPKELNGCRMNRCILKIYYRGELFDADKQVKFQTDPERVYQLLIGENIYKTRLEFIREYLQNALDATKMQLWFHLKEQNDYWDKRTIRRLTPFDIDRGKFTERAIKVFIKILWKKGDIVISIRDCGIGMEKECVKEIANVAGNSWGKRSSYASEIPHMPMWLQPTGGFGIGLQSAFMLTDQVEFITKSLKEAKGRTIRLDSTKNGGKVSQYEMDLEESGTTVNIRIALMEFLKEVLENRERLHIAAIDDNVYDKTFVAGVIHKVVLNYISEIADNALFPVKLKCETEKEDIVGLRWYPKDIRKDNVTVYEEEKSIFLEGSAGKIRYFINEQKLFLWDYEKESLVLFERNFTDEEGKDQCYYKGILVSEEFVLSKEPFLIKIIYFGDSVNDFLTVSRDQMKLGYRRKFQEDILHYRKLFIALFLKRCNAFTMENEAISRFVRNEIVMQALIAEKMEIIRPELYEKTNEKTSIYEIMEKKIEIKYVNIANIKFFCEEELEKVPIFSCINPKTAEEFLMEQSVFESSKIPFKNVLKDIEEKRQVFLVTEISDEDIQVKPWKQFRKILLEQSELLEAGTANSDTRVDDVAICRELLQNRGYLIAEAGICDILQTYGTPSMTLKIRKSDGRICAIRKFEKDLRAERANIAIAGNRLIDPVCRFFESEFAENREFPFVLSSNRLTPEEKAYSLWVDRIFASKYMIDLDNKNEKLDSTVQAKDRKYLILPFTENMCRRFARKKPSKEKFMEIAMESNDQKLLIEWVYTYQIKKSKLDRRQIVQQYRRLLEDIYEWNWLVK